ncbi:hypothetical protein [Curtobacterium sp. MCBA15_001]|uniref:hypothetical protein n=1 Tax=Curtobacterium sp. MCBA15_001 TaxID=1898731 RepID=UPI0008DD1366|nr:hypothetical protein [Curtobacterium sp. MCBA15_001]OIH97898.1 hypothetical protein BIU90_12825 [Curtobacterium sp. MCBA15_001]
MNAFFLRIGCVAPDVSAEQLEADFTDIADALFDLPGITDPDLELDANEHSLTFSMTLEAAGEADAMVLAITAARTALHMAGKGTPGWEDHYRMATQDVARQTSHDQMTA